MGLELDLSELAVIRPIRTAVSGANRKDGEEDAADTGCVTPTAAAAAAVSPEPRRQGGVVDVIDAGCVTPTAAVRSSPPRPQGNDAEDNSSTGCVTPTSPATPAPGPGRGGDGDVAVVLVDDDVACFVTPTSAASLLRPATECPPAPRKKPARSPVALANKRKHCGAPRRCFFSVPRDLTKVFVARGPADGSPPQTAAKKIRVHPVG